LAASHGLQLANKPIGEVRISAAHVIYMESNSTKQKHIRVDIQLSQPHFDDEATLLSARRVVPLGNIRVASRSGSWLALGFTIVFAAIVGSLGSMLIFRQQDQKQIAPAVERSASLSEPDLPDKQPLSGADVNTETDAGLTTSGSVAAVTDDPGNGNVVTDARKATVVSSQGSKSGQANGDWLPAARDQRNQGELRRPNRIETHRSKRNAEREVRIESRGHRNPLDDLLRIREIFEGPPRH